MDHEKLMADAVASVVEKVLMNIGMPVHYRVSKILTAHSLTFSDCYRHPGVLNYALKQLFDNSYDVVEKIKTELVGLEDNDKSLVIFIQKLSE